MTLLIFVTCQSITTVPCEPENSCDIAASGADRITTLNNLNADMATELALRAAGEQARRFGSNCFGCFIRQDGTFPAIAEYNPGAVAMHGLAVTPAAGSQTK